MPRTAGKDLAILLLGAGRSQRFGAEDKLAVTFNGGALLTRAAKTAAQCEADHLIAVLRFADQRDLLPPNWQACFSTGNMSDSLRIGVQAAQNNGASRVLVMLADMPFVTAALLQNIADACLPDQPACCRKDGQPLPPACFPRSWFERLCALTGDKGAGALLRDLPARQYIDAPLAMLRDIDRPGDLTSAKMRG